METLDNSLPVIPGKPQVQQINPPPYKLPIRVTFGKNMPKDKDEKDAKKKKKQVKKKALKKGEKPPEPIKWAEPFKKPPPDTLDLLRKAAEDASENIFPASIRED